MLLAFYHNALAKAKEESDDEHEDKLNLLDLPVELLQIIFSFVDEKTLIKRCPLVSAKVNRIVTSRDFWLIAFQRCYGNKARQFVNSSLVSWLDLKRLVMRKSFQRNLINDCQGKLKLWSVTCNGGNGFEVERFADRYPAPDGIKMTEEELRNLQRPTWLDSLPPFCYATSHGLCEKHQVIDLSNLSLPTVLDALKPPIAVGEWFAGRWQLGSRYRLKVTLQNERGSVLDEYTNEVEYDESNVGKWTYVTHVFSDYPPGVRKIVFQHSGVDCMFWRGHYGSKFTGATVKVLFPHQL